MISHRPATALQKQANDRQMAEWSKTRQQNTYFFLQMLSITILIAAFLFVFTPLVKTFNAYKLLPDDSIAFLPPRLTHEPPKRVFNATAYEQKFALTTKPDASMTTAAYFGGPAIGFRSGYRNMAITFLGLLLLNDEDRNGHPQLLLESLKWRDQQSGIFIPHQELFDVVHWNSFFPDVPRIVAYDKEVHTDVGVRYFDETTRVDWKNDNPFTNSTRPYPLARSRNQAYALHLNWSKRVAKKGVMEKKVILKALEGALRPHPAIQDIIDNFMASLGDEDLMVFHARIEPDMQVHPVCPTKKVTNLTDILNSMYNQFPMPPVKQVLIMLNRAGLEEEGKDPASKNQLAIHNLRVLNDMVENGLWGGKVQVLEAGTGLAENTVYHKNRLLVGGIINYYIALDAKVFIGTEVSSYSSNVVTERFFRGQKQNYYYTPDEMKWVTPPELSVPPAFVC